MATSMTGDLWSGSVSEHRVRQAEQIARAALGIVVDRGMSALTMSAIAGEAGISRQTLYRYYPDVESVLKAAMSPSPDMEAEFERRLSESGSTFEKLDVFMWQVFEAAQAGHPSPERFEGSLPPEARAEARRHAKHFESLLVSILEEGVSDGSFSPAIDPPADGRILHSLIQAAYPLVDDSDEGRFMAERIAASVHRMVRNDKGDSE